MGAPNCWPAPLNSHVTTQSGRSGGGLSLDLDAKNLVGKWVEIDQNRELALRLLFLGVAATCFGPREARHRGEWPFLRNRPKWAILEGKAAALMEKAWVKPARSIIF